MARLAVLNVALHVLGLAFAALGMRPGTPAFPVEERMTYLAGAPLGWTLGWGVWMVCALLLVAFLAFVGREARAPLGALALALAATGAGVDLLCDTVQIVVVPELAARRELATFLAFERTAGAAGLVAANGLYSVGVLVAALGLRERCSPLATGLGVATCVFGLGLAATGFTGVARHVEIATGPTIGAFCAWTLVVARDLRATGNAGTGVAGA